MLDLTRTYFCKLPKISYIRLCMFYPLMNKYYAATGNPELAKAYMDSSLIAENNRNIQLIYSGANKSYSNSMKMKKTDSSGCKKLN